MVSLEVLISKKECGDPDTIRTCDPQLRRLLLYPLSYGADHFRKYKIVKVNTIYTSTSFSICIIFSNNNSYSVFAFFNSAVF